VEETKLNGGWPYRRRLGEGAPRKAEFLPSLFPYEMAEQELGFFEHNLGLQDSQSHPCVHPKPPDPDPGPANPDSALRSLRYADVFWGAEADDPFPNLHIPHDPYIWDADYYESAIPRAISEHPSMMIHFDEDQDRAVETSDGGRSLTSNSYFSTTVTFVYLRKNLPSNIFNDADFYNIRAFEKGIMELPDYEAFCRPLSYYSGDEKDDGCAEQASAVSNWFFDMGRDGEEGLLNIDDTLKSMSQSGVNSFMDVFFSLDFRQSNLTRSTFNFQADSEGEKTKFYEWLTTIVVPIARSSKTDTYTVLYYDGGYLFDWEVDQAVFNDAKWSGLAFIAVFLFVWMHTRSVIISFFGMLGVTASIPITLWIYKDVVGIDHVSILNFLSLFVIMGIGADDM
jgi:hypothetical protein